MPKVIIQTILLTIVMLASCKNEDNPPANSSLLNKWEKPFVGLWSEERCTSPDADEFLCIYFQSDKIGRYAMSDTVWPFHLKFVEEIFWKASENELSITHNNIVASVKYTLKSDTLFLITDNKHYILHRTPL